MNMDHAFNLLLYMGDRYGLYDNNLVHVKARQDKKTHITVPIADAIPVKWMTSIMQICNEISSNYTLSLSYTNDDIIELSSMLAARELEDALRCVINAYLAEEKIQELLKE